MKVRSSIKSYNKKAKTDKDLVVVFRKGRRLVLSKKSPKIKIKQA